MSKRKSNTQVSRGEEKSPLQPSRELQRRLLIILSALLIATTIFKALGGDPHDLFLVVSVLLPRL